MRLNFKRRTAVRKISRLKKVVRIRKTVIGTAERPRLVLYRSLSALYAQVIDDSTGKTLIAISTLGREGKEKKSSLAATTLGKEIGQKALGQKIESVVFDRNGYLYHGRIKAFADAAREAGLKF